MKNQKFCARFLCACIVAVFSFSMVGRAQMIDLNGNGLSDIWEWVYGATNIDPNADSDGDGYSNLQEAIAGTNPFDSNSVPKISLFSLSVTNGNITMAGQIGKLYQLLSVTNLGSTNWLMETSMVLRAGTNFTFPSPANSVSKFYRIAISDVDSDGSGWMNDWEKNQLGLDMSNAMSNAQEDFNGQPMSDYAYVTNLLAQQNVITIAATDPVATEPSPGSAATDAGIFTITRGGFPLDSITVNLGLGGTGIGFATAGLDYSTLPTSVTLGVGVSSTTLSVTPLANTNLSVPVLAQWQLLSGANYFVGSQSNAAVVIYPSPAETGTGLLGQYFTNSSTTYTNTNNFNAANVITNRIDPAIDFVWTNGLTPNLSNGLYSVRWTGQVQPQYSELYVFDVLSDDGVKLWVNDQLLIDKWQTQNGGSEWTNSILLQANTRYDIRMDYLQNGSKAQAHLYWYSADQSKEIIPNANLYPTNSFGSGSSNAPAVITSALSAVAFLGQPFTFTVTAANTPLGFTATNLPPGLIFNSTNGIISGVPTVAGNFQVVLTASNLVGIGASVVNILVLNTGSSVVQEIWTNVPGINVADIPTGTPANFTNALGTLEGTTDYGDNYGERVRGYFTAPTSGNYYFWIAGSDSAQLWISDDSESVNKVLRAWVTPTNNPTAPGQNGTSSRQWNLQSSQKTGWLVLNAGQKYYLEILHKAGVGAGDNWSVGWLQDPTGTNNAVAGVAPNYLLARYYPPLPVNIVGSLYSANMLALPGISSMADGSATLRLSADNSQAILNYSVNGISSTHVDHIYSDPYGNAPTTLLFDIAAAKPQADGSYLWKIKATGTLQPSDIISIINSNKCSIVIQTPANPAGEIGGHFNLASGSQIFTPPPAPPAWTDDSANPAAASRFLAQATFGATSNDIASVQSLGYAGWINNQFSLPATHALPNVLANPYSDPTDLYQSPLWFNTWWQNSITAPDQLRQRVAFALSEIFVVSENGVLQNHADALSSYYDVLLDNAFGNFRTLLENVTLHPSMGLYLSMQGNSAGSIITGIHADENYAREIQQLFSIGLNREWPDGTLVLNSLDNLVPTYGQNEIMGFASVFTGWNYYQTNQASGRLPSNWYPAYNGTNLMVLVPSHHELGTKLVLDNVMLPQAWGNQAVASNSTNDAYCSQDLELALNSIFNNQNVAPFICRQLIQRLVTSNPSRNYVYRVSQVFNNDGTGVRGNMQAVVQAILLDYEARSPDMISQPTYGKQREALERVTSLARAFPAPPTVSGTYSQTTNQIITVTTSVPHLLNSGDTAFLIFTDTSGTAPPTSQGYSVTATSQTTFTISAPQLSTGTYGQTNGVLTLNISGNGLASNNPVYLVFTTGGASNGLFQVSNVIDSAHFTVATTDLVQRVGNCLLPKINVGGYTQTGTNIVISTSGTHGLLAGNSVYINFTSGTAVSGTYQIASVSDATHFTITTTNSANQNQNSLTVYSLAQPPLTRSGTVIVRQNTWNMSYTDSGTTSSLMESPLRSPTVFNFYYPGYEFPGTLASAGLTTPEFQLTTDTGVASQMNFIEGALLNNTGNTNGLSSFASGNGAIVLNLGPWMTVNYTTNSGVPMLVSNLNTLLAAGQLSATAQSNIVSYVASTNFPFSTPPSQTQMRDRVRAVVHMIVSSPDYIIQK